MEKSREVVINTKSMDWSLVERDYYWPKAIRDKLKDLLVFDKLLSEILAGEVERGRTS